MTVNDNPKLPGIEQELPKSIGSFQLKEYNDEHGIASVKYNVDNAALVLTVHYDTQTGEPEVPPLSSTPFDLTIDKDRGPNACLRRYTDEFDDGESAYRALKQVIFSYEEGTLYGESDYHYCGATHRLLDEYAADFSIQCSVDNWPLEFKQANVGLYDKDAGELLADFNIHITEDDKRDRGFLIGPADYTSPLTEPPLSDIEEPNALPEPGKLLYKVFNIVGFIGISPHPENTNIRRVDGLLRELHLEHDYHPDLAWKGYLEEAQRRGDLTEDPDKLDEQFAESNQTEATETQSEY